jgi:hypothetical protein
LVTLGVGPTAYTAAARAALSRGLWPAGAALPITLEQAEMGFRQTLEGGLYAG